MVENPPASAGDAGDAGSVPGWGRPPGGGSDSPLQHSCLGSPWTEGLAGCCLWSPRHEATDHARMLQGSKLRLGQFFSPHPASALRKKTKR